MLCGAFQPASTITGKVLDGTLPSLKGVIPLPPPGLTCFLFLAGLAGTTAMGQMLVTDRRCQGL